MRALSAVTSPPDIQTHILLLFAFLFLLIFPLCRHPRGLGEYVFPVVLPKGLAARRVREFVVITNRVRLIDNDRFPTTTFGNDGIMPETRKTIK